MNRALHYTQRYADELGVQFELLASTAEIYSHAGTLEAVNYGLNWIRTILQDNIMQNIRMYIEEIEAMTYSLDKDNRGGIYKADKARRDNA